MHPSPCWRGLNASAQSPKSTSFCINTGYDFKLEKGGFDVISIQPEFGKHFSKQFYLGAGSGLLATDEFSRFQIPLFVRAEVDFPQRGFTPYLSLQGGYDINVSGSCDQGRINPISFSCCIRSSSKACSMSESSIS